MEKSRTLLQYTKYHILQRKVETNISNQWLEQHKEEKKKSLEQKTTQTAEMTIWMNRASKTYYLYTKSQPLIRTSCNDTRGSLENKENCI